MIFEPNYFRHASVELTAPHYEQCLGALAACYARDWAEAATSLPALAVPIGVRGPSAVGVPPELARSWATTPSGMTKLGLKTKQLLRFEHADDHELTRLLVARHLGFMRVVELLLFDAAHRLEPWGGLLPQQLEWVVSMAGPPTVLDLGVALSPVSYSLEEAFERADLALTFEPAEGVPELWSSTLGDAIRWEKAASLELVIPNPYGAPDAIVGRGFHEFKNPFLQICNLWRSGVIVETRFTGTPTRLGINARRV